MRGDKRTKCYPAEPTGVIEDRGESPGLAAAGAASARADAIRTSCGDG